MKHPPQPQAFGPAVNRFLDVMEHTDRFAFKGTTRLAEAAGVNPSSVSRLIHGLQNPSFLMVARLADALEGQLGFRIDPRDLIAESGRFLTRSTCDLVGCDGCLPQAAYDDLGQLKPDFAEVKPGTWVPSRYPIGFNPEKGDR